MTRFPLLGLAVGLLALTAAADDPKPAPLDPAKLAGDWTVVEATKAGDKNDKPEGTLTVAKDKLTLKVGDLPPFVMSYKLDVKASPATIDMEILEPDGFKGGKAVGIVKMADGKVTLCYKAAIEPGKDVDRPKEFTSTKENGTFLFGMKKKEDKK